MRTTTVRRQTAWLAGIATAGLVAAVPAAHAKTVLTGQLHGPGGAKSGEVVAYAWPLGSGQLPLIGKGHADSSGRYTISAADPARLRRIAAKRGGQVDVILEGRASNRLGDETATIFPYGGRSAAAARASSVKRVDVEADRRLPAGARASGIPCPTPNIQRVASATVPTVVGELNNVYRDTRASFRYGRSADSEITTAVSPNGTQWELENSVSVTNGSSAAIGPRGRKGPTARRIYSDFTYGKYELKNPCPVGGGSDQRPRFRLRVDRWDGNASEKRQKGTIRVCGSDRGYPSGYNFTRDTSKAVTWTRGARVFGAGLSVRSGFSENVQTRYRFGKRQKYVLCGSNGRPETVAGRIFSGVRR